MWWTRKSIFCGPQKTMTMTRTRMTRTVLLVGLLRLIIFSLSTSGIKPLNLPRLPEQKQAAAGTQLLEGVLEELWWVPQGGGVRHGGGAGG
jgi:hypothetical protein